MGEDNIVVPEEEEVVRVWGWVAHYCAFLNMLITGRGRGSADYSSPFPNFLNAAVDPSQLASTYGSALISDSLNPIGR